jgi:hypothetical protein
MATAKQPEAAPKQQPKPAPEPKPEPALGLAGESSDPAVHALLADLETFERVGDTDGAAATVARLADLGVKP